MRVFLCSEERCVKNLPPFYRHLKIHAKKSHSNEWLNCMILMIKFGGPCWT
nr:MAG TPA: hypothetical protein [Caudoviricetes sp.]